MKCYRSRSAERYRSPGFSAEPYARIILRRPAPHREFGIRNNNYCGCTASRKASPNAWSAWQTSLQSRRASLAASRAEHFDQTGPGPKPANARCSKFPNSTSAYRRPVKNDRSHQGAVLSRDQLATTLSVRSFRAGGQTPSTVVGKRRRNRTGLTHTMINRK